MDRSPLTPTAARSKGLVLAAVALVAATVSLVACDPSTSLTRLGLFGFQRNSLISACCNCLDQTIGVDRAAQVCPEVDLGLDGGPIPDAGKWATPCLCGASATTCRDLLSNDEAIIVVGKCVDEFGPCADDCAGVLAYPGNDDS